MQTQTISTGSPVTFDSDEGPQRGTVLDIRPHIGNGEKYAKVNVPGTLGNLPWIVAVADLSVAEAA